MHSRRNSTTTVTRSRSTSLQLREAAQGPQAHAGNGGGDHGQAVVGRGYCCVGRGQRAEAQQARTVQEAGRGGLNSETKLLKGHRVSCGDSHCCTHPLHTRNESPTMQPSVTSVLSGLCKSCIPPTRRRPYMTKLKTSKSLLDALREA